MTATKRRVQRTIRDAKRNIAHAAGEDALRRAVESAIRRYETEAGLLDAEIGSRRDQFAHELEIWTGTRPAPGTLPAPIEADLRRARTRRFGALLALALEVVLFTALLRTYEWALAPALVVATVTTLVLGYVLEMIMHACFAHANPHVTLARLRSVVIIPMFVLFIPALAVLLLGRIAMSELAMTLLPVVEIALWASTIALLLIGAALGACADLLRWSTKDAERFAECVALRAMLETELGEARNRLHLMPPPPPGPPRVQLPAVQMATAIAALLFVIVTSSACSTGPAVVSQADSPSSTASNVIDAGLEVEIALDESGSMDEDSWREAADTVMRQLPAIVEKFDVTKVSVRAFSTDGWSARLRGSVDLPRLTIPEARRVEAGEAGLLPGIGKSISDHNRKEQERVQTAAEAAYRREVAERLKTLDSAFTLSPSTSACSDVLGVLSRASAHKGPAMLVIFTDGVESCGHITEVPPPASGVIVIVVLVASDDPEAPGASAGQFLAISRSLGVAAPWATVIPAFDADIVAALRSSEYARIDTREGLGRRASLPQFARDRVR